MPNAKDNQVLIKVKASAINNIDYMMFDGLATGDELSFMGKRQAKKGVGKHPGAEVSGIVEEVGKSITTVKKGDEVYAITTDLQGGWSEYALANQDSVYLKPANFSFEQAAVVPLAGSIALAAVRTAKIKSGARV